MVVFLNENICVMKDIFYVTLKKNEDFRRIYRSSTPLVSPLLVTYRAKNSLDINRIGITASKKIGTAVMRNRSKRLIREACRSLMEQYPKGYDFIFAARTKTAYSNMNDVKETMRRHLSASENDRSYKR